MGSVENVVTAPIAERLRNILLSDKGVVQSGEREK